MNLLCMTENSECYTGGRIVSPRASPCAISCTAKKLDLGHLAGSTTEILLMTRCMIGIPLLPTEKYCDSCKGGGLTDRDKDGEGWGGAIGIQSLFRTAVAINTVDRKPLEPGIDRYGFTHVLRRMIDFCSGGSEFRLLRSYAVHIVGFRLPPGCLIIIVDLLCPIHNMV